MIGKDSGWRLAAVLASVSIHFLAAIAWSERQLIAAAEPTQSDPTLFVHLNFPQPLPETAMSVPEAPQPVIENLPKPKPKPEPERKKPILKPGPKITPKLKTVAVAEPSKEPEVAEETESTPTSVPPPPPSSSRQALEIREAYLARLLAQIEKNKFYPTIARRRNLQGTIRVTFRLGCDGRIKQLDVQGGHNLLRKAAGKAVEVSLPLPGIPPEIDCPMLVDYAMAYTLEIE